MPAININLVRVCDGGCHATFGVSVDGGQTHNVVLDVDDIRGSSASDIPETLAMLLKIRFRGKTRAQIRNDAQAGIHLVI